MQVREALQEQPEQLEDFVSLLHHFEQLGEGQEVMVLFRKLRSILGDQSELLRDFAAFLYPEQALQCGLVSPLCFLSLGSTASAQTRFFFFSWRSSRRLSGAAASSGSWRSALETTLHITRRSSRLCRPAHT